MRGVNKVFLMGALGADPETRAMPSGQTVANLRVATNEEWKDKESGEKKSRTEWHCVAIFGRLAEVAGEYLKKGSKVYLEGSLRTRKWQDKQGNDRYTTEVVATEMQMLDSRQAESGGQQPSRGRRAAVSRGGYNSDPEHDQDGGDFDDDIAF